MNLKEDNSGYVQFPASNKLIKQSDTGKTFVYLVAFDIDDMTKNPYVLSNCKLTNPGQFVSDDIMMKKRFSMINLSVDDLIKGNIKDQENENMYFPSQEDDQPAVSIPLTTCVCIGWSDFTYEYTTDLGEWCATFRDLTQEGRRLYYSIKKLHNTKEVRLVTFNNI